jgi:hypothetical protein
MKLITMLFALTLTLTSHAFAHGENKYGPHMGYISMPGSFHIELVPQQENTYAVYILDLQNKKSLLKDSSIEMKIIKNDKSQKFNCDVVTDHFVCKPDGNLLPADKVSIVVTRSGNKANAAIYDLPLALKGAKKGNVHDMKKM